MQYLIQFVNQQRSFRLITLVVALLLPLTLTGGSASAEESTVAAAASQLGTAFTYQGQLKRDGGAFSGDCAFQFSLWDAETDGTQVATQALDTVTVSDGLFTAQLDFGNQFTGDARWLEVQVKCEGDADYTTLTPRILLTAAPYAIGLMPGAQTTGAIAGSQGVFRAVNSGAGAAIVGLATSATGTTYGILGNAFSPNGYAVTGYADGGATAVHGYADGGGRAVYGISPGGTAVEGTSTTGTGVIGKSTDWIGVYGESAQFHGVHGVGHNVNHAAVVGEHTAGGFAVYGNSPSGAGVVGTSTSWVGVYGESTNQAGAWGKSANGFGVYGESATNDAIFGRTGAANKAGVVGINTGAGNGIYARSDGGGFAAFFEGKTATRVLEVLGGADLAEHFNVSSPAEPGTLLVIDPANPGQLMPSTQAYDTRVAGIVSGAGGVNPGLTLQQEGVLDGDTQVAIAGRVYVQAEALSAPIQPGDLLTTSDIPGHAMKSLDHILDDGAVIGKAMTGLDEGTGLVLVLVNLQ